MNLKETIEKFEAAMGAVGELITKLHAENIKTQKNAQEAFDAYFADVRSKQKRLDGMANRLEEQIGELETKERALNAELIDATIAGDEDNLTRIQNALTEISAQKMALEKQHQTVVTSQVPRNKELYDKAVALNEALGHSNDVLEFNLGEIREVVSDFENQLSKAKERLVLPRENRHSRYDPNRPYEPNLGRCIKDFDTLIEDYEKVTAAAK